MSGRTRLAERAAANLRRHSWATLLIDADAGTTSTGDDLWRASEALAERIAGSGGAPEGAFVALQLPNSAALVAAVVGCWAAGRVPMPVDHDVAPAALDDLCRATGARAVVAPAEARGEVAVRALAAPAAPAPPTGAVLLKVTSGTTGEPRAVALSDDALESGVAQIVSTMGLVPGDRSLVTIPLAHSYAFDNVVLTLLLYGMPAVLARDLTPRRLLGVARDARATVLPTVPFLIDVLARSADARPLPDLRLVISAGAPLPVAARERFHAVFGLRPRTFYGATECGGIAFDRDGDATVPEGCVGTPLDGVRIEREDADEDGVGRVVVRSASVALGHHPPSPAGSEGDVELTPGVFRTADLGRLDEAGRLHLVGRVRDVVNLGGRKVYPAEVERVIRAVPGVRDAVVFGVARSSVSDALRAVVAAEPSVTREAIAEACAARLARFKVPRTIKIVSELPRTARGKLDRRKLDASDRIG